MAIRSGFFNSVNGDRKYDARRFAEYFATFISNGVFPNPSTNLQVMANNDMTVTVKVGKAWINGYILINDDDYILEIEPADGVLNRIDRVVARYDTADREIRLEVKQGTFASNPVVPVLQRDADAYELGLADIEVNAGVVSITQANITDLRLNTELCGIVHGLVDQVDTTTLFNQYLTWLDEKKTQYNADMLDWTSNKQNEFNNWKTQQETEMDDWQSQEQTDFEDWKAQEKVNFDTWFATIQDILDENVASNLQNQLTQLSGNVGELSTLETTDKTNLVDAVNELEQKRKSHLADYATFKNNIEAIKYEGDKLFLKVNGEWIEFKGGSQYPVGNVSGLKVDEDDMQVTINWIDPPDLTINDSLGNPIILSKWAGTQLRRKKLSYPSSENDGELVVDSKIRDQYKTNGYIDSGLVNDEEYFYMLFPYTEDGVFTVDSANRISATPTEIDPNSWQGIQKIVRKGLASEYFNVGDQLVSEYDGGEIVWEVIGLDVDTPADSNFSHSMTLQTKDCLHDIQFDAKEPNNPNSDRQSFGSNRYIHSAVRQWLNSNESKFQWKSQHQYDAKPTDSLDLYDGAGFLYRLDPELVAVLGTVNKKVAKANVDGGGQDTFSDKVFLLSRVEVGLGEEGDVAGEFVYPFYDGITDAGRIKQLNGSNRTWWLRSPIVSNSHYVRYVSTSGAVSSYNARNALGLSPACVII